MLTFKKYLEEKKRGLWDNIHAKRKRGEKPAKPGDPNYPDKENWEKLTKEEKDPNEYDKEGDMAKGQLKTLVRNASDLMKMMGDDDNLPEWVQSKITKAEDYISSVRDYLQSEKEKMNEEKKDPRLVRAGVESFNKPKRTPSHPTKSHIVVAKTDGQVKTIRFGEQGAETAGDPKKGESERMKKKRKSFKARHRKNIAKGPISAAYWADKVKW